MEELHTLQIQILKKLVFSPKLKFSELKVSNIESNLLNFHLKKLIDHGYISKSNLYYILTKVGKEYVSRVDLEKTVVQKQAKISVWFVPIRGDEALIYTRLKHPFFRCQGFGGGKLNFGEEITKGALRELFEETNLTGEATLVAIKHFFVKDKESGDLLEDKFSYLCRIDNVKGKLKNSNEGKFEWVKEKDFKTYVTNPFENMKSHNQIYSLAKNFDGNVKFIEEVHLTDKF